MMYHLKLEFFSQEDPFEEDRNAGLIWGKIRLYISDDKGAYVKKVIDMIWDIKELMHWIIENEFYLFNETFPEKYLVKGDSLAEYMHAYYETYRSNDEMDDEADDILETYSTHHNVYYGMSGTETENIYIGKRNGSYEISHFKTNEECWRFNVDLEKFMEQVKAIKNEIFQDPDSLDKS